MSPRLLTDFQKAALLATLTGLTAACGQGTTEPELSPAGPDGTSTSGLKACRVEGAIAPTRLAASRDGLLLGTSVTTPDGEQLTLQRYRGAGCELTAEGAPIAVGSLLGFDDRGTIYAFPAAALEPGVISTMLAGERPNSMVAKVDANGQVTKLLDAGRGIWDFGVSPEGGTLWMTACGPTGIFSMPADAAEANLRMKAVMDPPNSQWQQGQAVLTDNLTFWSAPYRTCARGLAVAPGCGLALLKSSPEASVEIGTTVDFGQDYGEARLRPCGARVCGVSKNTIYVWDDQGEVRHVISLGELGAGPTEHIEDVSGNRLGLYVLLRGDEQARVVFTPTNSAR